MPDLGMDMRGIGAIEACAIAAAMVVLSVGCGRVGYDYAAATASDLGTADTAVDATDDAGPVDLGCTADVCATCIPSTECSCATFGTHVYRFCDTTRMHADARAQCEAAGMRLVRVDDDDENTWIRTTADALLLGEVWVGAEDPTGTSTWTWPDGTQFWSGTSSGTPVGGLYNRWYPGRPQGSGGRECVGSWPAPNAGEWNDRSCTSLLAYVCELY
jgi:hypothetical protein